MSDWIDSISYEFIQNPVVAPDGIVYDLTSIERWMATKSVSPVTQQPMVRVYCRPILVMEAWEKYCATHSIPHIHYPPGAVRIPPTPVVSDVKEEEILTHLAELAQDLDLSNALNTSCVEYDQLAYIHRRVCNSPLKSSDDAQNLIHTCREGMRLIRARVGLAGLGYQYLLKLCTQRGIDMVDGAPKHVIVDALIHAGCVGMN
jgi:hypothetical protein